MTYETIISNDDILVVVVSIFITVDRHWRWLRPTQEFYYFAL